MILKKPYAFLIKYFRLIHVLLTVALTYVVIKTTSIVSFFNSFVHNGYYLTDNNIAGTHINFWLYLIIISVVLLGLIVYFLLKNKEKPTKFYTYLIIYYIFLLVILTVGFDVLKTLETSVVDAKSVRLYRDLSLIFVAPQFFFVIFSLIRAIGFDIKKFNFRKDINELEIDAKDNEEFEFTIDVKDYKIKRTIRRFFREATYYIRENKFLSMCVAGLLVVVLAITLYMNLQVFSKVYREQERFTLSGYRMRVMDSIVTPLDYKGDIVTKDKEYLIVIFNVENNTPIERSFKTDNFRLMMGRSFILPTVNKNEYFIDIATPYLQQEIPAKSKDNYLLVFELPKNEIKEKYRLRIQESLEYNKGELIAKYREITLKPNQINKVNDINKINLNEELDLSASALKNSKLTVSNYEVTKSYKYEYNFCITDDKCNLSTDVIDATYQTENERILLILDYNLILDKESSFRKNIKSDIYFFTNLVKIKYTYNDKAYITYAINKTPNEMKDKVVLEVPGIIKNAQSIVLEVTVRDKNYSIILK